MTMLARHLTHPILAFAALASLSACASKIGRAHV